MEDEYILMGMAAYGNPVYKTKMETHLFDYPIDDMHKCLHTVDMSKGLPKSFMSEEALQDSSSYSTILLRTVRGRAHRV